MCDFLFCFVLDVLLYFYCVYVGRRSVQVSAGVSKASKEDTGSLEVQITGGSATQPGCWELNYSPLQAQ